MVSVPMVKDLIHEKATANNDDMIKKKLAETFSLAPAKNDRNKKRRNTCRAARRTGIGSTEGAGA